MSSNVVRLQPEPEPIEEVLERLSKLTDRLEDAANRLEKTVEDDRGES